MTTYYVSDRSGNGNGDLAGPFTRLSDAFLSSQEWAARGIRNEIEEYNPEDDRGEEIVEWSGWQA